MANRISFPILLTLLFAAPIQADTLFKDPFEIHQPVLNKVVITPGAKLMTQSGQSALLSAQVIDEEGAPVSSTVFWRSTNEALVSVDSAGLITTHASIGSAQIIAEAEGALADVTLVTIADPVDNAILVEDSQVVVPPQPVDPEAEFGPGYEYQVTLSGVGSLTAGDYVLGSGEQPVGGQVVSMTKGAGDTTVVVRVVPLDELFDELVIHERIDLSEHPIDLAPEVAELFESTRLSGGSWVLSPRESPQAAKAANIGPLLKCEAEATGFGDDPDSAVSITQEDELVLIPQFSLDLDYDTYGGGLQQLMVNGSLYAEYELKVRSTVAYEGSIKCKLKLGAIPIPLGGPFALIFSGQVPLGVGAKISGKVSINDFLGFDLNVVGNANFGVGLTCQPNCEFNAQLDSGVDASAKLVTPTLDTLLGLFQLDIVNSAFFFADFTFGNPFFTQLQFNTFGVEAGVKHSGLFRSLQGQVNEPGFASEFKMELFGKAGPGNDILKTLEKLGIPPINLDVFSQSALLAESPKGQLVITDPNGGSSASPGNPAVVAPGNASELGELAQFTITLDPTTYLGVYNVEEVLIYWKKPDGKGGTSLELNRPGCNTLIASSGQKQFTCQADFLEEHVGEREFYAFVKASLFGVPVPGLLEIANNSAAALSVLIPNPNTMFSGGAYTKIREDTNGGSPMWYREEDYYSGDQPGSAEAEISVASLGSASASVSATNLTLSAFASAEIYGQERDDHVSGSACMDVQASDLNVTVFSMALSGSVTLYPTQAKRASAEVSVRGEINAEPYCNGEDDNPDYCSLEGEAFFCAPSLDGEEDCDGQEENSGVLQSWSDGGLVLQLGSGELDLTLDLSRVNLDVCVTARDGADSSASLSFYDLTQL